MRGIHFVQIPTSLTARSTLQSVVRQEEYPLCQEYGRTSPSQMVFLDPTVLETLGRERMIGWNGWSHQIWLIEDPELWDLLSEMDGSCRVFLEHSESLIEHSCQVKRKMVVEDELDNGIRSGPSILVTTIGHAIEATAGCGTSYARQRQQRWEWSSGFGRGKGLHASWNHSVYPRKMCQKFRLPVDYENWCW